MVDLSHWSRTTSEVGKLRDALLLKLHEGLLAQKEKRTKAMMIKVVVKETILLEGQGRTLQKGMEFDVDEVRFDSLNAECGGVLERKDGKGKKAAPEGK